MNHNDYSDSQSLQHEIAFRTLRIHSYCQGYVVLFDVATEDWESANKRTRSTSVKPRGDASQASHPFQDKFSSLVSDGHDAQMRIEMANFAECAIDAM